MIQFRKPQISDIPMLARVLSSYRGGLCDMTPGNIVMWREYYGCELAYEEKNGAGYLWLRYAVDPDIDPDSFPDARARAYAHSYAYTCPKVYYSGDENRQSDGIMHADEVKEAVNRLSEYGAHFFCCLSWEERALLLTLFPEAEVWQDRDWNDYVYEAEKMISLGGKHLSGQRNHINKFKSTFPDWHVERICEENIPAAREFLDNYYAGLAAEGKTDEVFRAEHAACNEVLSNWSAYWQEGIILYAGSRIAALTFGEVTAGMLDIHIEKANREFPGAYPMVFREFTSLFEGRAAYVNREEDCGKPGLRQSKLAYKPQRMVEKYNLVY